MKGRPTKQKPNTKNKRRPTYRQPFYGEREEGCQKKPPSLLVGLPAP